jgi:molybdopterin converting factor small subunit
MKARIRLNLYATLKTFMPAGGEDVVIEAGQTVRDLLSHLDIPAEKAKLIFVDGVKVDLSTPLRGGERLGIFPPVGGG